MADTQNPNALIYSLVVAPGIKRDGTAFESQEFTDGEWARFQRGKARKVGGYRAIFADPRAIIRGMMSQSFNGINYTFAGGANGVNAYSTATDQGIGNGPFPVALGVETVQVNVSSIPANNSVVLFGRQTLTFPVTATMLVFADEQDYQYTVDTINYDNATNLTTLTVTPAMGAPTISATAGAGLVVPTFVMYQRAASARYNGTDEYLWDFDVNYSPSGRSQQVLAYGGRNLENIDSTEPVQVYTGGLEPDVISETWSLTGLRDTAGQNPTGAPIAVDGGVCVLYPFIFVYGSGGYIANNHVSTFVTEGTQGRYQDYNFFDWNGPTANQVNVAAGKIVKGLPVRGGTNSPSGLFWATNALIRISFTGQAPLYWRNDILSTDCSIMSSKCVVEQDGVYYWLGTDRFYLYNGTVQTLVNDKNVNWILDNINFAARQKVWGISIKRYNEIWWFYPRGDSEECNAVVVYNTKDKLWYDMGAAPGCLRSSGWPAEVFPFPLMSSNEYETILGTAYVINGFGVNPNSILIDGQVTENLPGSYMVLAPDGTPYRITQAIYSDATDMTELVFDTPRAQMVPVPEVGENIYQLVGGYAIYQHEFGQNKVFFGQITAIKSEVQTSDISFLTGDPTTEQNTGLNRRAKLFRVEPNFNQRGEMTMTVVGRPYAKSRDEIKQSFIFEPDTEKIDTKIEDRLMSLIFTSNTLNGDFEMGRTMITVQPGDERP